MREWAFRVEGVTAPGEIMCVVGSCIELGEWNPENVIPMKVINAVTDSTEVVIGNSNPRFPIPSYQKDDGFRSTCETNRNSS